uniref:Putative secreted protein n=1 Tax=Anopheles triannulatus TaxID=58253 RepID=A0A2M4B0U5_9DIPT
MACTVAFSPLATCSLFSPSASKILCFPNSAGPPIGEYSWSSCFSAIRFSAVRTLGRTNGLPLSSRYAPTPRLIFFGLVSRLYASVTPRITSGGPICTPLHQELARDAAGHCTASAFRNSRAELR